MAAADVVLVRELMLGRAGVSYQLRVHYEARASLSARAALAVRLSTQTGCILSVTYQKGVGGGTPQHPAHRQLRSTGHQVDLCSASLCQRPQLRSTRHLTDTLFLTCSLYRSRAPAMPPTRAMASAVHWTGLQLSTSCQCTWCGVCRFLQFQDVSKNATAYKELAASSWLHDSGWRQAG
jgi:hypothetical protein